MRQLCTKCSLFWVCMLFALAVSAQVGIGTTNPDPNSILHIVSTTSGVLIPRLSAVQMATLAATLGPGETGMLVTDAVSGGLMGWNGQAFTDVCNLSATAPLSVSTTNQISINPGTAVGDLITWDGNNWVNMQPAVQHFFFNLDNRQPFLALNFCIAMNGIFPARNDAVPFVSQIQAFPFNFAPLGWALCNGQLIAISSNTALFSLLGTTYGGNGISNFQLPDLQGRVPVGWGTGAGLSPYNLGQNGGAESVIISQ